MPQIRNCRNELKRSEQIARPGAAAIKQGPMSPFASSWTQRHALKRGTATPAGNTRSISRSGQTLTELTLYSD